MINNLLRKLLREYNSVSIHQRNIQGLAIEMIKAENNTWFL